MTQDPASAQGTGNQRRLVFICYNVKDKPWLDQLLIHLAPQRRDEGLEIFVGEELELGSNWREEIEGALGRARIAILLVSPYFLASKFIAAEELPPLLKAAKDKLVKIVPLWLQPSDWDRRLKAFQGLNPLSATFSEMTQPQVDRHLTKLSKWIRQEMAASRPADAPGPAAAWGGQQPDASAASALQDKAAVPSQVAAPGPTPSKSGQVEASPAQPQLDPSPRASASAQPAAAAEPSAEVPWQRGGQFSIGLGALLLVLLIVGLLAGRYLSGLGHMIWWLLAMAAFALLATAVSAGIGGAMGVWKSREAKLVGPPAIFVVIFSVLIGASRVMARAEWQAHGTIVGLPAGKEAEVHLSQCHPQPIDPRTGGFSVHVNSNCDADPLPMTILVADCAVQRESVSQQEAREGIRKEWRSPCGTTRFAGRVVATRQGQPQRLTAKVWIWPVKCPEVRGDTNDRDLFTIERVPSNCQFPPHRLAYRMEAAQATPVAGEVEAKDPLDVLIEIPLPGSP